MSIRLPCSPVYNVSISERHKAFSSRIELISRFDINRGTDMKEDNEDKVD